MRLMLTMTVLMAAVLVCTPTAKADTYGKEQLQAEKAFLLDPDSPKLYTMDDAIALHKTTGKPVLCWMGEHVFADFNARKLSQELKDTTIQASMASDGSGYDKFNPRVKFDTNQYVNGGRTYFIRTETFKFKDSGIAVEETTAYKVLKMFDSKEQPAGKDPLSKATK